MARMIPVYIDTAEYEQSHGRRPRGRGRWLFEARDPSRQEPGHMLSAPVGQLPYAEARRDAAEAARKVARRRGWPEVEVAVLP